MNSELSEWIYSTTYGIKNYFVQCVTILDYIEYGETENCKFEIDKGANLSLLLSFMND